MSLRNASGSQKISGAYGGFTVLNDHYKIRVESFLRKAAGSLLLGEILLLVPEMQRQAREDGRTRKEYRQLSSPGGT